LPAYYTQQSQEAKQSDDSSHSEPPYVVSVVVAPPVNGMQSSKFKDETFASQLPALSIALPARTYFSRKPHGIQVAEIYEMLLTLNPSVTILAAPLIVVQRGANKRQGENTMSGNLAKNRSDGVEEKLRLLEQLYRAGEFDIALSLAESLKDTLQFERQIKSVVAEPLIGADTFEMLHRLPPAWQDWARGWKFCKMLTLREPVGLERCNEPVDIPIAFRSEQVKDVYRELRVARVDTRSGELVEVPNQVYGLIRCGNSLHCRLIFFANVPANSHADYLILFGNPAAELPEYPSDLVIRGEGVGLDIENQHFIACLSRQMGQLERLIYRREHALELFAGGPGHGEPPGIDWAHDYVTGDRFEKMRITNWAECPNYEVIRGPLCVKVRRWGFPHSPVHPLFTPSRLHIDLTYTFFAGLPFFFKEGWMRVVKDLDIAAMRDDEWVFSGFCFTDPIWIDEEGTIHEGSLPTEPQPNMQGIGYFNRYSRDAFIALWLELEADGFENITRHTIPNMYYRPHGHCWARYPAGHGQSLKAGAWIRQRNAYLVSPYFEAGGAAAIGQPRGDVQRGPVYRDEEGRALVQRTRRQLLHPLIAEEGKIPESKATITKTRLARSGETEEDAGRKERIWEALREVPDAQFYTVNANVVDMGYIYDIRVRGETVIVLVTMPHRGRPMYQFIGDPIRERLLQLEGVREVIIEFTWDPPWSAARLTDYGREMMGIATEEEREKGGRDEAKG